jgi:hypothetical protein
MQEPADVVGLAFADHKFLLIAKSKHPPMTRDSRHLTDVIHIHYGVAVHTLETRAAASRSGEKWVLDLSHEPLSR